MSARPVQIQGSRTFEQLTEFPSMTVVSLTNMCTHRCTHCQHRLYEARPGFSRQDMDMALLYKIADELAQHPGSILRLSAWGEPCLYPELVDIVAYASNRTKVVLITNGYALSSSLSLQLMKSGLCLAEISIDAAHADTYHRVRASVHPDAFDVVTCHARRMIEQRNLHGLQSRVVVSYVTWPNEESEREFADFHRTWSGVADDVVKRRLHSFSCAIDPSLIVLPPDRVPCFGLWGRCVVDPWGRIVICYNQWEESEENVLADLRDPTVSISGTWRGPAMTRLRHEQTNGIFTGPCANCRDYNPFAWEHPFEEVISRSTSSALPGTAQVCRDALVVSG
jgi:pyruvate-formate lyase-activating enzyme